MAADAYQVLARKWRPRTFDTVVGQDVVTEVLGGAIREERIGHAYLFTGPRGTGKTTCARIFAKALNCESGPTPNPCGTCERCQAADAGAEADLIEIDAATHTGVDSVRALRDQAVYVPMRARFKVYLIDEVHMLSKSAFNALLKTLEEPPDHVKFLFATTEPHKVPDTVLSRCQILRLDPVPEQAIAEHLAHIFKEEGVQVGEGVLTELARRARGGLRDALSLSDQLLALVGDAPQLADLDRLSGEGGLATTHALVEALEGGDRGALLAALPAGSGREEELVEGLLGHLRGCLLAVLCGDNSPLLMHTAASPEQRKAMSARAKRLGGDVLEVWLQELLHARERMRLLPSQARLIMELTLLDLLQGDSAAPLGELVQRLEVLESRLGAGGGAAPATPAARAGSPAPPAAPSSRTRPNPEPSTSTAPAKAPAVKTPAVKTPAAKTPVASAARAPHSASPAASEQDRSAASATMSNRETWDAVLAELRDRAPSLAEVLERSGSMVALSREEGRAVIQFGRLSEADLLLIRDGRNGRVCADALSSVVGQPVEVTLEDPAGATPGAEDLFTARVARELGGQIQERS
jgi:DNA polymerase-3 subunit gamma/tau